VAGTSVARIASSKLSLIYLNKNSKKIQKELDKNSKIWYNSPVMKENANKNGMKKVKKLMMFEDPGHGWCRVRRAEKLFQKVAKDITSFSYQRGDYVYLEEDYDLGLYYKACVEAGYEIQWVYNVARERMSKIRNYQSYKYQS
jgi:hypothetical protein